MQDGLNLNLKLLLINIENMEDNLISRTQQRSACSGKEICHRILRRKPVEEKHGQFERVLSFLNLVEKHPSKTHIIALLKN